MYGTGCVLPVWALDPSVEKSEWLNKVIGAVWPCFRVYVFLCVCVCLLYVGVGGSLYVWMSVCVVYMCGRVSLPTYTTPPPQSATPKIIN